LIPPCNATNYHEFWCYVANGTDSFESLATKLHLNPTKLWEYNFLYDRDAGVVPGDSLRVPYGACPYQYNNPAMTIPGKKCNEWNIATECAPCQDPYHNSFDTDNKSMAHCTGNATECDWQNGGTWNIYTVQEGDTLLGVATSAQSMILNANALKNANLDILYGDSKLYVGQQLRIPLHTCYDDESSDCHAILSANESLDSIASEYKSTAAHICKMNAAVFGKNCCDSGIQPLPRVNVGMELLVPRRYPTPPKPCNGGIAGYWNCATVKAGDTLSMIAIQFGVDLQALMEANWAGQPARCKDCTKCASPSPDCLKVGQVLAVPVTTCQCRSNGKIGSCDYTSRYNCVVQGQDTRAVLPGMGPDYFTTVTTNPNYPTVLPSFQQACDVTVGEKNGSCTVVYVAKSQDVALPPRTYCSYRRKDTSTSITYPPDQCLKHWLPVVTGTKVPLSPSVEWGGNWVGQTFPSLAVEFFCQANRRSLPSCRNSASWWHSEYGVGLPAVLPFQGPFKAPRVVW
jgi:LysM repeat protein